MKLLMALALFACIGGSTTSAQSAPPAPKGGSVTVTGCLAKTTTEEYSLTSDEGKKYELRTVNNDIKLADHVGHRVTVTAAGPAGDTKGPTTEHSSLDVIALVMVSQSCAR